MTQIFDIFWVKLLFTISLLGLTLTAFRPSKYPQKTPPFRMGGVGRQAKRGYSKSCRRLRREKEESESNNSKEEEMNRRLTTTVSCCPLAVEVVAASQSTILHQEVIYG